MSICRAAQKHMAFCREKINRVQAGISPSPRKSKAKQNPTQKTSWQSLSQGNQFALFSWDKEAFRSTQHLPFMWLVVFDYLFLPWFPCGFWRPGNVEMPQEHTSFADSKTEQSCSRDVPCLPPGAEESLPARATNGSP